MKKKSQSQRKTPSNKLSERNDIARNKYSNINTFRQTKESKCFSSNDRVKKKLISYQDSPRTIDYIQVMQKYEHLIDQNSENGKRGEKFVNRIRNNYYKTENNLNKKMNSNKKNLMKKNEHNNNTFNKENISSNKTININRNDFLINCCKTDDSCDKILKNTFDDKNNTASIREGVNNVIFLDYENSKNKSYKSIRNFFSDKMELDKNKINNFFDNNEENKRNITTTKNTKKNISFNCQSFNNLNNTNYIQNAFLKKYSNNSNKSFSLLNELLNKGKSKSIKSNELISNYDINNNNNILLEKINHIISLCQKYAKIMSNSINFIEVNTVANSTDIFHELKNIIKQYNKFVFSEKIKMFISQEETVKNKFLENTINNLYDFTLKEFEPKNLNFTEKFRNKISALKNEKSKIYDELNNYKKKNKFLALEKDELDIVINKLKKENEELTNKIKNLENMEMKYNKLNNENNKLKGQIDNLNIDIKYKENIIKNLQQILEQVKYNSNIMSNNYPKNNNIKNIILNENNKQNNESGFLSDINNNSITKDIISPCNLNVNSIIENIINLDEDDKNKKSINETKINNNISEEKKISEKMEKIDQDILDLKTKLKKIYSN